MFCPNCGTKHDSDARFCSNCGKKLESISTPTTAEETATVMGDFAKPENAPEETATVMGEFSKPENAPEERATVMGDFAKPENAPEETATVMGDFVLPENAPEETATVMGDFILPENAPEETATVMGNFAKPEYAPEYAPEEPARSEFQPVYERRTQPEGHTIAHKLASSPIMLLAAIALVISLALGFMSIYLSDPASYISDIAEENDIVFSEDIKEALESASDTTLISAIIASVVPLLCCIAVWMIYVNAKKGGTFTAGLSILKVLFIIGIVILGLVEIILAICTFATTKAGAGIFGMADSEIFTNYVRINGALTITFSIAEAVGVMFGIAALIVAIYIIFYARLIHTVNSVKRTILTHEPKRRGISAFAAICCYAFAILELLGLLCSILLESYMTFDAALIIIANMVLTAVINVCFGILIFKYRAELKGLAR